MIVDMEFVRVTDPNMAVWLVPWLVPGNQTVEDMLLMLWEKMKDEAEKIFVCVGVTDDIIEGMSIAFKREDDVFIWQAFAVKKVTREEVDTLLNKIKVWAKEEGFNRVCGIPNRAKRIWQRRWGFKQSEKYEDEVYLEI